MAPSLYDLSCWWDVKHNTTTTKKTLLFQGSRGGGGGGGPTFSRGKMHITCDFSGGGGYRPPIPPLDLHMAMLGVIDIYAYAMSTD